MDRAAHPLARPLSVCVVGAGWAGLAAAVRAHQRGARVTLIEMARRPGGRAGSTADGLDGGAHILIGAYTSALALMRRVGAEPAGLLRRTPLDLRSARGEGLVLPPGPPALAFMRGVLGWRARPLGERLALLRAALGWRLAGFDCPPERTVAQWAAPLPGAVRRALIEPLCLAALNTRPEAASAQVLLRVLRDALFAGPGSADLLLPRAPLAALLPDPALAWLRAQGAAVRLGRRVRALAPHGAGWLVDGQAFDAVVLAATANEAARLAAPHAPPWAASARALASTAIATVWLHAPQARWPRPMLALDGGPAQFGFDLGALQGRHGLHALCVSAVDQASDAAGMATAVAAQFRAAFTVPAALHAVRAERRATFACTPGLVRPMAAIAPSLLAAGDYVAGPYPATLEGAVRAGVAAADALV